MLFRSPPPCALREGPAEAASAAGVGRRSQRVVVVRVAAVGAAGTAGQPRRSADCADPQVQRGVGGHRACK
eukprot:357204-Chlamydomonas_euryale.AAC.1